MLIVAAASHQNENSFNYRLMLESLVETKCCRSLVNSGDNRIFLGGSYQKKKIAAHVYHQTTGMCTIRGST